MLALNLNTFAATVIARHARLVVDTRNVFARKGMTADHIVKS